MDISDFLKPDMLNDSDNDIYLDDIPVESLLYKDTDAAGPTPADIIPLWNNGFDLTEKIKRALVAILVNEISIAVRLDRIKEAESILKEELESIKGKPSEQIRIVYALNELKEIMDQDKTCLF